MATNYISTLPDGQVIAPGSGTITISGVASINKVAITAPATAATLTIANNKTLTASNTLTLAGTDGSTLNVGAGGTLNAGAVATLGTGVAAAMAVATNATGGAWLNGHTTLTIDAASANDGGTIASTGSTLTVTADRQLTLASGAGWDVIILPGNHIQLGGITRRKTTAGITASTTQTQGQGALTSEVNEVATCANANDTVTLPSAAAGMRITVINNGAQTLRIFPASGDDLGAGVNTATTLAAGSNVSFISYNATNWEVD